MLKRVALFLLILLSFTLSSSSIWAFKKIEPEILTINGYLRVYSEVAREIVKSVQDEGNGTVKIEMDASNIRIPEDSLLLKRIITLFERVKVQNALNNTEHWKWDGNIGIKFNADKDLIDSFYISR
ncbi:MAG: hypothetical protein LBB44_03790 [Endomicrobium sp.]|nr:hypothetical protein [Endomicrobium sp.]